MSGWTQAASPGRGRWRPPPPIRPPAAARAASTHIEAPDLRVVLSEHLEARREALHEAAAAVVTESCAPGAAGAAQQQQDGEQGAPGRCGSRCGSHCGGHCGGLLEEQGGGGRVELRRACFGAYSYLNL